MRQIAVAPPSSDRRGWPAWVRAGIMVIALGATGVSLFAPAPAPILARPVSPIVIPPLVSGWAGGGVASPSLLCPPGGQPGQCLATPYGTVFTRTPAQAAPQHNSASLWLRPLRAGQWHSTAVPLRLARLGTPGSASPHISLVGASGPWVVANAVGPGGTVSVDAVNMSGGRVIPLTTVPASVLGPETVGSGMVLVDNGSYVEVFTLPAGQDPSPTVRTFPEEDRTNLMQSLVQGFLAPEVSLPGLPAAPGARDARLVPYEVGTWTLPFRAPRGWVVVPPHDSGTVTSVALVNPRHPGEWVAIRTDVNLTLTGSLEGAGRAAGMGLPTGRGAHIAWLSDRTIAFSTPSGPNVVNGVIYPSALGGVTELEVSLPANEKALATAILDSPGLPY